MDSGLIYANARIKSLENNLLTTDKMLRMIDAVSLDEAVKVLIESNYGGGVVLDNPNKFENLLNAEINATTDFIREIMPKGLGMEIFFLKLDYHNAKALMKSKYLGLESAKELLTSQGLLDIDKMNNLILNDEYKDLYPEMAEALDSIDRAFAGGERSPRLIDVTLDKAYYEHATRIAGKGTASIKKYLVALADFSNISTFIRCRRADLNYRYFTTGFIAGGELREDYFQPLYEQSDEIVGDKFKYTRYKYIVAKALEHKGKALVDYETAVDNYLLSIFKDDKHDMFSVAPMAGYYLAKLTEIKVARMILVCIKNKVDKILIKQRLREMYA